MDIIKNGTKHVLFPFKLRPLQKQVIETMGRFCLLLAHRRFGKTMMCVLHMVLSALTSTKKQPRYWYIFPQEKQAREVVLPILKDMAQYIPNAVVSETRLELTFDLGDGLGQRLIGLKGVDKGGDNLRGAYLDGVVMDEMKDMPISAWTDVIRPMLSDRLGWAILTGTAGQGSWYEMWQRESADLDSYYKLYDFKVTETGLIADHEISKLKKEMGMRKFNREYMNDWFAIEDGSYYAELIVALKEAGYIDPMFKHNPAKPVVTAWDLGVVDATAIWFVQEGIEQGTWNIIDYLEFNKSQLLEKGEKLDGKPFSMVMLDKVKAKPYFYAAHILPHDAVHQHHSASLSTYEMMRKASDCKVLIAPKQLKLVGIEAVQNIFNKCRFDSETCLKGISSLHAYKSKMTKDGVETAPDHNKASHGAEAFSYFASSTPQITEALNMYKYRQRNQKTKSKVKSYNPFS